MTSWKTYRAEDYCLTVTDGTHDSPKPQVEGRYLITSKHLKPSGIDFSYANKICEYDYQKIIQRSKVEQYDILFSMIGTIGNIHRVTMPTIDFAVKNMGIFKMGGDADKSLWMYYWLQSPIAQEYIQSRITGSTQGYLTLGNLRDFPVCVPPLEEQRRIAGILGAIDDKIENNRRINANLELQAQALYKQWFVDNRSDDWEEKPLAEIAEFIGGYSYKGNELVDTSTMAMATIKNFERKGGFKVEGFKDIVASSKLKVEQHAKIFDILVAHTDLTQNADVIGNAEILLTCGGYSDIIFSMDLVKVLPKENFPYKFLLAAMLKNPYFKAHCLEYVNGTTVLHMSKKALPEYVFACPSNEEAEKMDNAFKAYYQKMAEILQENETLATLRDTLLPKLMNGEIKL